MPLGTGSSGWFSQALSSPFGGTSGSQPPRAGGKGPGYTGAQGAPAMTIGDPNSSFWAGSQWQAPRGPTAPASNPALEWLRVQQEQQNAYRNSQMANLGAQATQSSAYTQMQSQYAREQAAIQNQMLNNQMGGVGNQQARTTAEHQYNQALGALQNRLSGEQMELAGDAIDELGRHYQQLESLAYQGLSQTGDFLNRQAQLDQEILAQAVKWLGQQGGYNAQDLANTQRAIANVLQTQSQHFAELGVVTGRQTELSGRARDLALQNAQFQRTQGLAESEFQSDVQTRNTKSSAIASGAMTSQGFGQDIGDIRTQRSLADTRTQGDYTSAVGQAQLRFDTDMEAIRSAYRNGEISYQDAQRQAADAQARAQLGYEQNVGSYTNQRRQAELTYAGNDAQIRNALAQAQLQYDSQREGYTNQFNQGYNQYEQGLTQYNAGVEQYNLEQQNQERQYQLAMQQYQRDLRAYQLQQQQNRSGSRNQQNQLAYENAQRIAQLNQQRAALGIG